MIKLNINKIQNSEADNRYLRKNNLEKEKIEESELEKY